MNNDEAGIRLLLDVAKADRGSMEMFGEPVGRDDVKLK